MSERGFTLIEVIVAIAISALIAAMAYQSLSAATEAAQRSALIAEQVDSIDKAWQILETDLRHAVKRGGKSVLGIDLPALEGGEGSTYVLSFVRTGWTNPLNQPRSTLQRVAYEVEEEVLYRHYWYVVDGTGEEESQKIDLLDQVSSFEVRFLPNSASGIDNTQWQPLWPIRGGASDLLPMAVEVTLELEGVGEITRIFALASG